MILGLLLLLGATVPAQDSFDARFTGRTLRYDFFHSGTATEEHVSLDGVRLEGPWPGSRVHLLDATGLGKYRFTVRDGADGEPLYSRGFASIYGEWETIREAKERWRTFHESLRFPEPRAPCRVVLEKRGPDGRFRLLHEDTVDPAGRFVDRSPITPRGHLTEVEVHGAAAERVDLLVLGEGYAAGDADRFLADVRRLGGVLLDTEPFASRRERFNVRALFLPAPAPGISNPRAGRWVDAPLGLSFNAFDLDRYVLTFRNRFLREVAAQAPYDALLILFHDRKYGGGGIFNLYTTCSADTSEAAYVFVHEFGHSFGGLADEYYTSQVAYEDFTPPGTEPWEPNVTALLDPAALKWKELVAQDTPLPTPWNQAEYDAAASAYQERREQLVAAGASEEELEALFDEVKAATQPLLEKEPFSGRVGAFEGASYEAKGLYRPEVDCIMFSRNRSDFCAVCRRALERVIALYAE